MSRELATKIARIWVWLAGLTLLVSAGALTASDARAHLQEDAEKARVAALEQQVLTDASIAADLHAERERQTDASVQRTTQQETLAYIVIAAAVAFVLGGKWLIALRGSRVYLPPRAAALRGEPAPVASSGPVISLPVITPADGTLDLSAVDEIVAVEGRKPEAAIPILQALQARFRYLPRPALERICELTEITPAQLTGVASFYTQFRQTPVGEHLVKVCHGTACHVAGAPRITDELRRLLGIASGEDTDAARRFTIEPVACMGCCTLAPVMQIDGVTHGHLQTDTAIAAVAAADEATTDGEESASHALALAGTPVGEIRVGLGSCCVANGSGHVFTALQSRLAERGASVTVKRVGCVGMCHQTPLVEVDLPGRPPARYARVHAEHVPAIVRQHFPGGGLRTRLGDLAAAFNGRQQTHEVRQHTLEPRDPPVAAFLGPQQHIATEHCGCLDPIDLDEYVRHDGFRALRRCREQLDPDALIAEIREAGLRGRGGAGFPTAEKWARVHAAAGDTKYIICNGDEGDPGAFMDRMLMESYPYRIIEGVAIAAHAVGAAEGIFYIRREYPLAAERIREAVRICTERGLLDGLHLRVVEGAGAFVCGEESALIESLEGRRGMPRLRPPFPAEKGLWGRPTLVGNVETYAVVPWILRNGPAAFAAFGTATSKGTKVFALAGKVARGGLIEVPMGVTIRQIVEEIGGGVRAGHRFKAVQIGGPSGGCVPAELADTPVDYEALAGVGAMMGSGGLVVLDETDCMVDMARYFLAFTQEQSCGKCTHCRIGTRRLLDILERLCSGQGRPADLDELEHLARTVSAGSLCGLGRTAPNPVLTTLRYFRDEYEAHVAGRCPAGRCKELIRYEVTEACTGCTLCAQACPVEAIAMTPYERHAIDDDKCTRCDTCRVRCPEEAIRVV
ncbi:MAG: NAD(P)H-dependent oxidoreductase subunit E [Phycisphaerae bacterium]|jgi:NADH:ubiquinone oxidoreductase subunit F (NADH-binding)/NADH:ubiquinone oxidoreductase subunit E/Pyruvate/2-oxoacid:ferredoxin oxidoreductase delta subunit